MQLPQAFSQRMQTLLGSDYPAFAASYEQERSLGLRVNPLRISPEEFARHSPFALQPVPWASEGFFYNAPDRPGRHPWHEAGVYYLQEPSAMAVGALADPQPGERVLDLCAAPGGKTTHLGGRMAGCGLLVSNEIHPARARILSQNVERMGLTNCVVTNETPQRLAQRLPGFFDCVVVDAPCSGEGMFRKDEEARAQWSPENVALCAARQREILSCAAAMLRPGGRLIYSTCTFAPEEDEASVDWLLHQPGEFRVMGQALPWFERGRPDWVADCDPSVADTWRLWPHKLQGEGHFMALLEKNEGETTPTPPPPAQPDRRLLAQWDAFQKDLPLAPVGNYLLFGDQLYLVPDGTPDLKGLKVLRPGWHLGTLKKNRFEPSHSLALGLRPHQMGASISLNGQDPRVLAWLRGETLELPGQKGWNLLLVDDFALGWGKWSGGQLKNHFPKGLRWQGVQ
ncbi:MAG: RsmF rRNA methyltransferase first C-terminal domain-containing protein [Eubacteriales bacterium]|jgi:NOL1/NOP2/sun family putative RNA methylase